MSNIIHSFTIPPAIPDIKPSNPLGEAAGESGGFQNVLTQAIQDVESYRQTAEASVNQFLSGERGDLHNVTLDTQRAELAFELFLQTRNKVVQAYQEVMRMQV